jgi:hypothetical protein
MTSLSTIFRATALAALFASSPAAAKDADIVFMVGYHCTDPPGFLHHVPPAPFDSEVEVAADCTYSQYCDNDQYRSVWIAPGVRYGTQIKVWDNSGGRTNDDWAEITIGKVVPNAYGAHYGQAGMCISSFEQNRDGRDYHIVYHRRDNLDHRISRIEITPAPRRPVIISKKRGNMTPEQVREAKKRH